MQRTFWTWSIVAVTACGLVGCTGSKPEYKTAEELSRQVDDHDHHHGGSGPNGGTLVELGDHEFHAEFTVDAKAHIVRVLILGPDAKTLKPIAATEVVITPEGDPAMTLKPAEGQSEGSCAIFEFHDDDIVHELAEAGFVHGTLAVKIGDKEYKGYLDAHFDGDHDHDHPAPAEKKPAEPKEETATEKPAEEKPADDKPAEEKSAEEKPTEDKPAEEKPTASNPEDK